MIINNNTIQFQMETTEFLKKSEIDTTKLYYAIEIAPYDSATDITYHSYNEVSFN